MGRSIRTWLVIGLLLGLTTAPIQVVAEDFDQCPNDPNKITPGLCGCGFLDTDSDNDAFADCVEFCPLDAGKIRPGVCGCGVSDEDSDLDGIQNCNDACPADMKKSSPGQCGCGRIDSDENNNNIADCFVSEELDLKLRELSMLIRKVRYLSPSASPKLTRDLHAKVKVVSEALSDLLEYGSANSAEIVLVNANKPLTSLLEDLQRVVEKTTDIKSDQLPSRRRSARKAISKFRAAL